jgi:FkbM family methyltransferase
LLSSADLATPFDVGPLHVLYDGPTLGRMRATVVRHPRVERTTLVLGYDLYYSADDPGYISNDLHDTGIWEPSETAFIRQHVKPGAVVVDVGANIGYFTVLAARIVGASGRVIAVEPDPVSVRVLQKNVDALPQPEIVEVVQAAAGEKPGWVRLYRSLTNHGDHRVFQVRNAGVLYDQDGALPRGIGVSVPMRRMDEILAHIPHVDFVKVDTQGFDFAVLKSMEAVLRRDQPILICEFWPTAMQEAGYDPYAFRDLLLQLGYRLYRLPKEQLEVEPITLDEATISGLPETGDLNLVALPASPPLEPALVVREAGNVRPAGA